MQDKKIIVFDGVCILCNSFVKFVLRKEKRKQFYFTTAQSEFLKEQMKTIPIKVNPMDSVIYLKNGKVLTESTAVLSILSDLGGMWKVLSILKLIPSFIRNSVYRFCARRRYQVFGMLETCMVPSNEWKSRFLL
jgi:predicted DCC family thiol-disulfide oxidoreductase YuxK